MKKVFAGAAFAFACAVSATPAAAEPVCSGAYDDYQNGTEVAIAFEVDSFCTGDGPLTVQSPFLYNDFLFFARYQTDSIPITVSDGNGSTVFYWTVNRYGKLSDF